MDHADKDPVVEAVHEVSSRFDLEYWRDVSARREFPSEYWKALGRAGLFGMAVEKEWGGMEKGLVEFTIATQETAEHYAGLGSYLFLSGALTPTIFTANASAEMKRRILPSLIRGDTRISIALAEEEVGLDALSIKTFAKKVSDHYVIDGSKMFVTNADSAGFLLLFARTKAPEDEKKWKGISMFLVDARSKGLKAEELEKLGMDFNTLSSLEITGLKVEADDLVGTTDEAWRPMREVFEKDRVLTSASLVGTGKLALGISSAYARQRKVFNRAVGSNQGIQFPLADAWAKLTAAETMARKAASLIQKGKGSTTDANMSLLLAQAAAATATDRALQAFGGHGYLKRNDVERFWRDVRVHRLHPITEEILLSMVAEKALGLPASY